jgi:hypothetical protein
MEALAHEIEVLRTERAAKMENELADAGHLIDLTSEAARLRSTEREIEILDGQHVQELKKMGILTDQDLRDRAQRMELEIARVAQEQSASNLKTLMDLEDTSADRDADRNIRTAKSGGSSGQRFAAP